MRTPPPPPKKESVDWTETPLTEIHKEWALCLTVHFICSTAAQLGSSQHDWQCDCSPEQEKRRDGQGPLPRWCPALPAGVAIRHQAGGLHSFAPMKPDHVFLSLSSRLNNFSVERMHKQRLALAVEQWDREGEGSTTKYLCLQKTSPLVHNGKTSPSKQILAVALSFLWPFSKGYSMPFKTFSPIIHFPCHNINPEMFKKLIWLWGRMLAFIYHVTAWRTPLLNLIWYNPLSKIIY